jgi:hypothetical protein
MGTGGADCKASSLWMARSMGGAKFWPALANKLSSPVTARHGSCDYQIYFGGADWLLGDAVAR